MRKKAPCSMMFGGIGVLSDGTATICPCRDLNGDSELVVGNIKESGLKGLCHSSKIEKLRNLWFQGISVPAICADCKHYNPYTYLMLKEVKEN